MKEVEDEEKEKGRMLNKRKTLGRYFILMNSLKAVFQSVEYYVLILRSFTVVFCCCHK